MRDTKTYTKFAEECEELAKTAAPQHREILLEMARVWRRLADQAEAGNGTRAGEKPAQN